MKGKESIIDLYVVVTSLGARQQELQLVLTESGIFIIYTSTEQLCTLLEYLLPPPHYLYSTTVNWQILYFELIYIYLTTST